MKEMKKKIFTMMAVVVCAAMQAMAQAPSKISGTITDNKNNALKAITISLLNAKDSSLVKADVTDAAGKYEITTTKAGDFLLKLSAIGYETKYSKNYTIADGQTINADAISLAEVSKNLQGVTVVSKKPMIEVKADKTVFNVEQSINAQGSDALELLRKSPGVQVDNNENISMKGKTGVRVYVDGKMMQLDTKDLAAYLKSINSNDIEAIEMISNPSAKYDASGNAGIVNIRLKKNKKFGTNGSVNLGFVQGFTPKGNGSLNLNYRDKKVNVFGNVGGNVGINRNSLDLYRIQNDSLYDQTSIMRNDDKSMNVKAGADFFINKKNTIGVLATTNFANSTANNGGTTDIYYNPSNTFVKKLEATNTIPAKRTNANFNLNYRYADTSGTEINFDTDYGLFRGTGRSFQPNYYKDKNGLEIDRVINRNYTPTDIDIFTAKIDVEQRLGKGKLGYGLKTAFVTTKNTFDFFTENPAGVSIKQLNRSNSFTYKENVNAGYMNYQRQLNEKWSLQTGLRLEQTTSDGDLTRADGIVQADNRVKRNYVNLFPSAALTWNINQKHSLNFTYSRRIDRPTYQDLNPFENKLDELTFEKGNAFLRPQYTDNVEMTHTFMGFINTTVGYSFVKDFATVTTDTAGNTSFIQQKNLAQQQIVSFNIGAPTPVKKWWNGYVNFWFNKQFYEGVIGDNKIKEQVPSFGGYIEQSFSLGKDYAAEISGWFSGPSVWGGTWKTKPMGSVDIGVQKQFLNKAASVKIAATDIFFTSPWKATSNFGGLYIRGGGAWESQTLRVTFSYRFGSAQIKSARERKAGSEAEAKRIKGGG
jgi:iron complex outermembrane recepter protein